MTEKSQYCSSGLCVNDTPAVWLILVRLHGRRTDHGMALLLVKEHLERRPQCGGGVEVSASYYKVQSRGCIKTNPSACVLGFVVVESIDFRNKY